MGKGDSFQQSGPGCPGLQGCNPGAFPQDKGWRGLPAVQVSSYQPEVGAVVCLSAVITPDAQAASW